MERNNGLTLQAHLDLEIAFKTFIAFLLNKQ